MRLYRQRTVGIAAGAKPRSRPEWSTLFQLLRDGTHRDFADAMDIRHDESAHRFTTSFGDDEAYVEYEKGEEGTLNLTHTVVPQVQEGKGVASALVKHAFDYARQEKVKIIPSCSFAAQWVKRNSEYEDLLAASTEV